VLEQGCRCVERSILRFAMRRGDDHAESTQHPAIVRLLRLGSVGGAQDAAGAVLGSVPENFHRSRVGVGSAARVGPVVSMHHSNTLPCMS